MRKLIIFVSVTLTWSAIQALNATTENAASQNKTKRGITEQTHYYGDPTAVKYASPVYQHDSTSSAASHPAPPGFYSNPRPILYQKTSENEPPKQVTVQQVLYEYQQTPHNAVSNVHVNQQFQTAPTLAVSEQRPYIPEAAHSQTHDHFVNQPHVLHVQPNQYSAVAAPVQHGAVIHHGQGYTKLLYNPFNVAQTTHSPLTQNLQPRYVYANGKILYHPLSQSTPYPGVVLPARAHTLVVNPLNPLQQLRPTVKPFKPSPFIPITYTRYQTHPNPLSVKPTEAAPVPVKEEAEDEEEDEKSELREQEEDDEEDHSSYEEEDEEEFKPAYFSKYRYEDDEDDHEGYREQEDDEEEDNARRPSRYVRKHPKKYASEGKPGNRYQKNDGYQFKEEYKTNSKYASKSPKETRNKKPKAQYKTYKFYKASSNVKPKKEAIEGRQSQNVPIIHNKKLVRQEQWLISSKKNAE